MAHCDAWIRPGKQLKLLNLDKYFIKGLFCQEERGVMGRVSKSTWISAHNRQRASLLCHWGSANSCRTQKNKTQQIELTSTGYRLLGPDKKTDFASPKNMLEVHGECNMEEWSIDCIVFLFFRLPDQLQISPESPLALGLDSRGLDSCAWGKI